MKWLDVLQNSDEWYSLRVGKVTSSKFPVIMAHDQEDKWGDPAKRYAAQKAIERVTGRKAYESPMKNEHLDRGHEQEQIARRSYESRYFVDVTNGGFFDHDTWGDSPDGLLGDDGVIEIKSVIAPVHYATLKRGSFDPTYTWQIAGHLDASNRKYCDFVSYCSEFPEGKDLFVCRIYRDEFKDKIERLRERRAKFIDYIKQIQKDIENYEY